MIDTLLIASTNPGKIQEVTQIIHDLRVKNLTLLSLSHYSITEPEEPYDDFLKNAIHKAQYYGNATQQVTLSDDSGLCIEALNGFPGVKTKDFLEECGSLDNAFSTLEAMLSSTEDYTAYFHTAIAVYDPTNNHCISYEAKDHGTLSFPARGTEGFGFDPIFIPEGFQTTTAELGVELKNRMSHRSKALKGIFQKIQGLTPAATA